MGVRVASQIRIYLKKNLLSDRSAIEKGLSFIRQALEGVGFVETGRVSSGSFAALTPLTWAADADDSSSPQSKVSSADYQSLLLFLRDAEVMLSAIAEGQQVDSGKALTVASYFGRLGQLLGRRADNALNAPDFGTRPAADHFSYQ